MIDSKEEFIQLRASSQEMDHLRAAREPASNEVWMAVITDHPEMRVWVARNKTVPTPILRILASDSDVDVRLAVAMKNKLSQDLLALLAADEDPIVRQRIAYNKSLDRSTLETLARDQSTIVSTAAKERLETKR